MDPAQIIIFVVVIVLTLLLVFLGIQAFYVLRELRQTLAKTNKILDTADQITQNISNPVSAFSSVISGVKAGSVLAGIFNKIKSKEEKDGK
jgi:predicted PurR-regulated permease PerM